MDTKRIEVRNYASFVPTEDNKLYKPILNEKGEEVGFEVSGKVTQFDATNFNGLNFDKGSYDKCIANYFEKNNLNIPIDVMHQRGIEYLVGYAKTFVKREDCVEMTAFVPKGVHYYELVKTLIDNGILQGFSNLGFITDGKYDSETDSFIVKDFSLISVSLVDVPADTNGKFVGNATDFRGFTEQEDLMRETDELLTLL